MLYNNATIACGRVVGWLSKYQSFVILFSTEAKYVAAVKRSSRWETSWYNLGILSHILQYYL